MKAAKGPFEAVHILLGGRNGRKANPLLIVLIGFVGKRHHLLIALREHANCGDHTCNEASSEGPARKAKDINVVPFVIVSHDKAVASKDVLVKSGTNSLINQLGYPSLDPPKYAGVDRLMTSDIGSDSGFQRAIYVISLTSSIVTTVVWKKEAYAGSSGTDLDIHDRAFGRA